MIFALILIIFMKIRECCNGFVVFDALESFQRFLSMLKKIVTKFSILLMLTFSTKILQIFMKIQDIVTKFSTKNIVKFFED